MTHYDVLDVDATASASEIRRSYLALARDHHPDFHTALDDHARAANEREMQRINEAWSVLSDEQRRRAYDDELRRRHRRERTPGAPSRDFVPFDEGDDTDYAAALDDEPVGEGARVSQRLQVLPVIAAAVGVMVVFVGLAVQSDLLAAWGAIVAVLGVGAFIATPVVAVMRSYRSDRDA
nr:J domain-containing protein [Rhabdothermincola salaria]